MKRSTAKLLLVLSNILLFVAIFVVAMISKGNKAAMFGILIVAIVIDLPLGHFLRCPNCHRGQGKSWLIAQYCPHCGEPLDD